MIEWSGVGWINISQASPSAGTCRHYGSKADHRRSDIHSLGCEAEDLRVLSSPPIDKDRLDSWDAFGRILINLSQIDTIGRDLTHAKSPLGSPSTLGAHRPCVRVKFHLAFLGIIICLVFYR